MMQCDTLYEYHTLYYHHPLTNKTPLTPTHTHINNCRSVPSYDAVWGSNHAYGGASMTVGKDGESGVLQHVLDVFSAYTHGGVDENMETSMRKDGGVDVGVSSSPSSSSLSSSDGGGDGGNNGSTSSDQPSSSRVSSLNTKRSSHHVSPCSDCVTVIHRVGEGFRQQQRTNNGHSPTTSPSSSSSSSSSSSPSSSSSSPTSSSSSPSAPFSSSSVNPSLMNATLWIEIDCGHFYRSRHSWPMCR